MTYFEYVGNVNPSVAEDCHTQVRFTTVKRDVRQRSA